MTDAQRYRAAFSHVHAPARAAEDALARLEAAPRRHSRHRPVRLLVALAAVLALLALTVGAEISSGAVSNLLAPVFGGVQSELIDSIGYPIGASATADGYTITAEAVIGDRYNVAIVYTVTRDDGEPFPPNARFDDLSNSATDNHSGGGTWAVEDSDPADNRITLVETHSLRRPLFSPVATVTFGDLSQWGQGEGAPDTPIAAGPWTLRFALRYQDNSVTLPLKNQVVTDALGKEYRVKEATLSPVGLHLEIVAPVPDRGHGILSDFTVSLRLKDGTQIALQNSSHGGGWTEGDTTVNSGLTSLFDIPVPPEEVEALILCGTAIPLALE